MNSFADPQESPCVWPDQQTLFRHNSKTNMSSLRQPTIKAFPEQLAPPTNVPLRVPPPKFAALDEAFNKTEHPILGPQAIGGVDYHERGDNIGISANSKILEKHIKDRTTYVQSASDRLQAACQVRNNNTFDLPELPKRTLTPSARSLFSMPKESLASSAASNARQAKQAAQTRGKARLDSGIGPMPKIPLGMHVVDKETGKGLREFLLQKGKEFGSDKQDCKSISFHDFTPDMTSGKQKNVLLGEYGVEKSERIVLYEIDLPSTQWDPDTEEEKFVSEKWIWMLLSRPMVSYDPRDSTTIPPAKTSTFTSIHDPFSSGFSAGGFSNTPEHQTRHATPPNFIHPLPTSWLVFAAPMAHVTAYPEEFQAHEHPNSAYPLASPSRIISKRRDFDFSFCGIPIFEFSSEDLFPHTASPTRFLSIEQMGAWSERDAYEKYSPEQYAHLCRMWQNGEWSPDLNPYKPSGPVPLHDEGNPKAGVPPPNRGVWWTVFYRRMYEDCARWEKIKKAMGMGRCRIVVRWDDFPEKEEEEDADADADMDVDGDGDGGLGVGTQLSGSQGLAVRSKKGPQPKRVTRNELRRRSTLGLNEMSISGEGGGGAGTLAESSKMRGTANREVGLPLRGVNGERDKKVRKR